MKKLAVLALILIAVLTLSQAKTNIVEQAFIHHKKQELNLQTQTKNVLAVVVPKHQKRFAAAVDLTDPEDDDVPGADELDLQTLYRRPKLVDNPPDLDEPLSDYVRVRLFVARARAMQKYRQMHL